jgi:hypothetical protein
MQELPLACSLETSALEERLERWRRLNEAKLLGAQRDRAGVTLRYRADGDAEVELRELIRLEGECCAFLNMTLRREGGDLRLDVSGPPEAAEVVEGFAASGSAAFSRPS